MKHSIEVPGYQGRALHLNAGQVLTVTDIEGMQIGDLFLIGADDRDELFNAAVTRIVWFDHWLPRVGDAFYSNRRRPMATIIADSSPGLHDMSFAPCDGEWFESEGYPNHPNCRDNYRKAMTALGVPLEPMPDPINLFQNTPVYPDGRLEIAVTQSKPGDRIALRADIDLIVVVTACSVDFAVNGIAVNGAKSTPLSLSVTD